jgi:hypothetical protein
VAPLVDLLAVYEQEALLQSFSGAVPEVRSLMVDVRGMDGPFDLLVYHAVLRILPVPTSAVREAREQGIINANEHAQLRSLLGKAGGGKKKKEEQGGQQRGRLGGGRSSSSSGTSSSGESAGESSEEEGEEEELRLPEGVEATSSSSSSSSLRSALKLTAALASKLDTHNQMGRRIKRIAGAGLSGGGGGQKG